MQSHLCETLLVCNGMCFNNIHADDRGIYCQQRSIKNLLSVTCCCFKPAARAFLASDQLQVHTHHDWARLQFLCAVLCMCVCFSFLFLAPVGPGLITGTEVWPLHSVTVEKWLSMVQQQHVLQQSKAPVNQERYWKFQQWHDTLECDAGLHISSRLLQTWWPVRCERWHWRLNPECTRECVGRNKHILQI